MKTFLPLFGALAVLLCTSSMRADVEGENAGAPDANVRVTRYVRPQFPERLSSRGITFGEARVVIEVDREGRLADCLVTAYSDRAFADSTVRAIQSWAFDPAKMDGQPVNAVAEVTMRFRTDGIRVFTTLGQTVEPASKDMVYQPCALSGLDRQPKAVKVVDPSYPRQIQAEGVKGTVTLNFYVDERGRVRVPEVKDASVDFLAATAVAAIKEWRFEPPTSGGRPVLVHVSQSFNFVPQPGS